MDRVFFAGHVSVKAGDWDGDQTVCVRVVGQSWANPRPPREDDNSPAAYRGLTEHLQTLRRSKVGCPARLVLHVNTALNRQWVHAIVNAGPWTHLRVMMHPEIVDHYVRMTHLSQFLELCPSLETLEWTNCKFQGVGSWIEQLHQHIDEEDRRHVNASDWARLAHAFPASLTSFSMVDCRIDSDDDDNDEGHEEGDATTLGDGLSNNEVWIPSCMDRILVGLARRNPSCWKDGDPPRP